ncbi:MAG: hypothetical protein R3D58_23610 [Saprospiraceae bacterium]|nr:hypothetical protein [Lewinellaceae bacterium]
MRNDDILKQEEALHTNQKPIPNISDIEHNVTAQNYLRERSAELGDDDAQLFEEIYQAKLASGTAMIRRRAMRREAARSRKKPYSSYLADLEAELEHYGIMAKEDTAKAMLWLSKDRRKTNKGRP